MPIIKGMTPIAAAGLPGPARFRNVPLRNAEVLHNKPAVIQRMLRMVLLMRSVIIEGFHRRW